MVTRGDAGGYPPPALTGTPLPLNSPDRRQDHGAAGRIDRQPRRVDRANFPADWRPVFLVFIDTEEEFDWSHPLSRRNVGTGHVPALAEAQARLAAGGATPTYVVDWPITQDERARDLLGGWAGAGEATVGLHLHPWVNPPIEEDANPFNSFAGNLPPDLEERKLTRLRDEVAAGFGVDPLCYRAGRYGVGPNTAAILERLGIGMDVSARPAFSYRTQGGPDFSAHGVWPSWGGPTRQLLEVPLGVAHLGLLRRVVPPTRVWLGEGRLRGVLSRARLLSRVPLTPEGTVPGEAVAAIDRLVADRVPVLSFSFHSPSLEPGHTPYVRDASDLRAFWRWWDAVFNRLAHHGVSGESVQAVLAAAQSARASRSACQLSAASATAQGAGL